MSWMYQLHMCYTWYSTWAFFVYCGHLGFRGLGWLHIVHCLPEQCMLWMWIKGSHCHLFLYWVLTEAKLDVFRLGNMQYNSSIFSDGYCSPNRERKKVWFMFISEIRCVDLDRATRNFLERKIYSNISPKIGEQALVPECLSVLHMLTEWALPHQFISLHCNTKQHIWYHLKVCWLVRNVLSNEILTCLSYFWFYSTGTTHELELNFLDHNYVYCIYVNIVIVTLQTQLKQGGNS